MEAGSHKDLGQAVTAAVDTHAHVTLNDFDVDRDSVIARARSLGVSFVEIGFDVESSRKSVSLARDLGGKCAVGIHPHNASDFIGALPAAWKQIEDLAVNNREVVAVGEMGLDFARDFSPRDLQEDCFLLGIETAKRTGLTVVIHQRDAEERVLSMLRAAALKAPIIFHCFSGNSVYAERCLELGGYIGLGGSLTYPKNNLARDAVKVMPLDRILLETDCPYLAPQTMRGKRNEPALVLEVARAVAEIRDISLDLVLHATAVNAKAAFLGTDVSFST